MKRILIILVLILAHSSGAWAETLDVALDNMVAAYGGETNLRKTDRMVQEWDLVAMQGNSRGTDRRSVLLPGHLKVELTYPHKKETRLLRGESGVVIFRDGQPRAAKVPQRDAMRLQMMRLYSPLALRDRIERMTVAPGDGQLVLSLHEFNLRTDYFVNETSWRIEKVVGHLSVGGGVMTFVTEYSDFDFVDGVLIHHRENKFAGGVNTAVLQLRNVVFDVQFADVEFEVESERQQKHEESRII